MLKTLACVPGEGNESFPGMLRFVGKTLQAPKAHGSDVRVGLEDNLYLGKGQLATNAQLVEKAVTIVRELGANVCGPADARKLLRLPSRT